MIIFESGCRPCSRTKCENVRPSLWTVYCLTAACPCCGLAQWVMQCPSLLDCSSPQKPPLFDFLTEMSELVLLVSFDKMIVLQFRHWLLFPLLVPGSATDSSRVSWRRLWASATGTTSVARFSTEGGFATDSTGWYGRKQASTKQEEKPYKLSNMFADLTVYKCVHCGFTL